MIAKFLNLEWKQFFRSMYWQKGIAIKMLMGFFALGFIVIFSSLGIGVFFLLKKEYPDADPFEIVNSYLLYAFIGDLVFRYIMQKLPIMNIKPLLVLPIKKSNLIHYVLGKSSFSFYNVIGLFFYIPFSFVLMKEGYNQTSILSWLIAMILLIQVSNYLNFLINKNNIILFFLATLLISGYTLQYFQIYDPTKVSSLIFNSFSNNPIYIIIPFILLIILYLTNYKQLKTQVYLDDAIQNKVEEAKTTDLSWVEKLGDVAPFIKNDIRLIWRNKRTKTVFLMSFLFLFYGLMFFTNSTYKTMPSMLIFAALFITGGFTINYGQFIPAWDSEHYKMLMTQNISYRKFLESKWYLMVIMTTVLFFLSVPYIYFGLNIFLMIASGAVFNIGFNSLLLLYTGSFNRKKIDLTQGGFSNMQGTSATQFLILIPVLGFPMLLFWIFSSLLGFNAGVLAIGTVGLLALVFKNYCMNFIEKKYINDKYAMIKAFNQNH